MTSTLTLRKAQDRGVTRIGWLESRHTFSFGGYQDPKHMGFRSLRVLNDDRVQPGMGFGEHGHRDMEIFSYVIDGELEHKDSMGNGRTIRAGEFQYMSAGSGVRHSEFNPSRTEPVHFLQIWIEPRDRDHGSPPRYADMNTRTLQREGALALFASPDGRDGSMPVRQDALIHFGKLARQATLTVPALPYAHHWLHVIQGSVGLGAVTLEPGDAAGLNTSEPFPITAQQASAFLLFTLA